MNSYFIAIKDSCSVECKDSGKDRHHLEPCGLLKKSKGGGKEQMKKTTKARLEMAECRERASSLRSRRRRGVYSQDEMKQCRRHPCQRSRDGKQLRRTRPAIPYMGPQCSPPSKIESQSSTLHKQMQTQMVEGGQYFSDAIPHDPPTLNTMRFSKKVKQRIKIHNNLVNEENLSPSDNCK